jgi:hypothetical protein
MDSSGQIVAHTQALDLQVNSAILPSDPKPSEPEGALPPQRLPFPKWVVIGALGLASLLALFLISLGIRLWRRVRKQKRASQMQLSEDEWALVELRQLQAQDWIEKRHFKSGYFRVSEILKNYIGQRFRFDAPECTTGEMMRALSDRQSNDSALSAEGILQLRQLFDCLDRVKFTDYQPEPQEPFWVLAQAQEWVVRTRRMPTIIPTSPREAHASG